jgi:hypothetical protein
MRISATWSPRLRLPCLPNSRSCQLQAEQDGPLARDGSATSLSLVSSLGFDFPAGSEVRVLNRVRYYVKHERGKPARVMREVDGGTNPLIGAVSTFQFRYLTREGMPTRDPAQVVGIRIEAAAEDDPVPLIRTIGLRGW